MVLCLCGLLAGCARRTSPLAIPAEGGSPVVGIYRGRLVEAEGENRRFRLLLFVDAPDRVHGEVVTPVGSTAMIVDGGGGALAVTVAREGVSYVGEARPEILERILGVRLSLGELVGAFRGETERTDRSVLRSDEEQHGFPVAIEFRAEGVSLSFELKDVRRLRSPPEGLGTGRPPAGTEIRGLDELGAEHRFGAPGDGS